MKKIETLLPAAGCMNVPSMCTVCGVLLSFCYYMCFIKGNLPMFFICFLGVSICDALDGKLARKFNQTSIFGKELDSLCDFGSFIIFPALVLINIGGMKPTYIFAAMVYIMCGVMRLAYFNTLEADGCFVGVSAPLASVLLMNFYYVVYIICGYIDRPEILALYPFYAMFVGLSMIFGFKVKKYGAFSGVIVLSAVISFFHCLSGLF